MFEKLTPEDIRLRFFAPMKRLSRQMAARLTQIDYDREMALVAVALNEDGEEKLTASSVSPPTPTTRRPNMP